MQMDGNTPLWLAARYLLAQRCGNFFQQLDLTMRSLDSEDIHDLRVASRRLREGLSLFAACYPPRRINRLARQVRHVTRLLGKIRNDDEAIIFFDGLKDELANGHGYDPDMITAAFRHNRSKEIKKLKSGLKGVASGSSRELFSRAINTPLLFSGGEKGISPFDPLVQFAGSAMNARIDKVLELLPHAGIPENLQTQHQLRIAVKHLRYRMEILSFLFGTDYEELHGVLKSYQDLLGKMHDLDVFAEIVRNFSFHLSDPGHLIDLLSVKRGRLFEDFSSLLDSASLEMVGKRMRDIW